MKSSIIKPGIVVWIPCEVKGGPFPNERRVYIKIEKSEWFGFVDVSQLRKGVTDGSDDVQAKVLAVQNEKVVLGIRGQSPTSRPLETRSSVIGAFSPVSA
ncbi:MAG TPA: hypothetical protein VNF29_10970 [Candidatus Binataceae bacterium]|nr:hypothetical protein [Candidatus Binataceae bacterium]